jgi:hypothetical protein
MPTNLRKPGAILSASPEIFSPCSVANLHDAPDDEPKMKSLLRAAALAGCLRAALVLPLAAVALAGPAQAQPEHAHAPPRRGDYLPNEVLRAGPKVDYAAARLRRPPAGYGWFALAGVYALASVSTGLIVEVVAP